MKDKEEDLEDGKDKQKRFKNVRETNTTRRRSRRWQRKNEDVREYTKDEDYKMKITKYVPTEINCEDVRKVFQNFP